MAGLRPDEGEKVSGDQVLKNITTDRGTNLDLLLFTDVAPGETITEATITEPTGSGYARITLTDATWTESAGVFSYAKQTFTPSGAPGWTVRGYAIATKGTTARLIAVEEDPGAPIVIADENSSYSITPGITFT